MDATMLWTMIGVANGVAMLLLKRRRTRLGRIGVRGRWVA